MRRAKDGRGHQMPLTKNDVDEMARFARYLEAISDREKRGATRDEAEAGASVEIYPEHLPQ